MIIVPFFRGVGFFNHQPVFWSLTSRTMEPPGPVHRKAEPGWEKSELTKATLLNVMISLTFWG